MNEKEVTNPDLKDKIDEKHQQFTVIEKPPMDGYEKSLEAVDESALDTKPPKDFHYKEGGWGWLVVIATSYCFGILVGMMNNYALIYNKLEIVYNGTENAVFYAAWIGSLSNGLQFLFTVFGSVFVGFYSPRKCGVAGSLITVASLIGSSFVKDIRMYFLTHGLILAIGQAMLLAASLAILPHYFSKKLSLANGITNAVASIIVIILPVISSIILKRPNGLQETWWFLAGLNVIAALLCLTYKSLLPNNNHENFVRRLKKSFGIKVFKKRNYNLWLLATFCGMFGYLIPIVNIDHHSIKAFPDYNPVIINVIFSAAAGVAAITFGKLGDHTKFNPVHYHTFVFIVYGAVQITIPFATSFYVFCIQLVILGVLDGIWLSFKVPIGCHLVGSSSLSNQATGYYHAVMAPMAITGPAVAGALYEHYHNYDLAFYVGGIGCLICGFILVVSILIPDIFAEITTRKKNKVTGIEEKHPTEISYF